MMRGAAQPGGRAAVLDVVQRIARAYDSDGDKFARLYRSMITVVHRRIGLSREDAELVVGGLFRRAAIEPVHIRNPFGWLMDAALSVDARARLQRPAAQPTFEEMVRDAEGEDEAEPPEPELLLE